MNSHEGKGLLENKEEDMLLFFSFPYGFCK